MFEVIKSCIKEDARIKLICLEKNSGAAVARNTGIENASGRFIAFLDSDDRWHPEKLQKQVSFMLDHDYALTYTQYHQVNEHGELIGHLYFPDKTNYHSLLKTCIIGCLTAMYDTQKLGKVYFPLIRKRQDFALWLKILQIVPYAYCLEEDLASYTVRSDSISSNKFNAAQHTWNLYRNVENLALLPATYYFLHYAIRGVCRKYFKSISNKLKI